MFVNRVQQYGDAAGWNPLTHNFCPWQANRNEVPPLLACKSIGLRGARAVAAIGHEAVMGDRAAEQFDGSMLFGLRQRAQPRGMRRGGNGAALRQVRGLLEP